MSSILDRTRALCSVVAPSGRERGIAEILRKEWARFGQVEEDRLGNLSVTVGSGSPHVAFVGHMDEVGFVVRRIAPDGFVALNRLGGIPERVLAGQRILLMGRQGPVPGVFATWPHHYTADADKYRVQPISEAWVDVGARTAAEVEDALGLRVGDFGVYERSWHVAGDTVMSNALDDRIALAAMEAMLDALKAPERGRVTLIASVQEEFSIRALVPTVRRLAPDVLVVVDISPATDTPGVTAQSDIRLGAGPVLHLHSFHGRGTLGGVLPPEWLVSATEQAATEAGVRLQRASAVGVITDGAFALHLGDGIPTIEVGIATRYTHCPVEACSKADLEALPLLLAAMARAIAEEAP